MEVQVPSDRRDFLGVGWKFPLQVTPAGRIAQVRRWLANVKVDSRAWVVQPPGMATPAGAPSELLDAFRRYLVEEGFLDRAVPMVRFVEVSAFEFGC